jgi:hypothetical protein
MTQSGRNQPFKGTFERELMRGMLMVPTTTGRSAMISEIVLFRLPDGMSRADAMAKYRARVPMWQANPDLIHKAFLFDEKSRRGGGVYLWNSIEAAKKAHGPAFEEAIQSIFGSKPEFQYFEAPIVIDNAAKEVVDNAA